MGIGKKLGIGLSKIIETPVLGTVKGILDKFVRSKMSEAEYRQLELQAEQDLRQALQREDETFRSWVVEYEGRASDLTPGLLWLRGSVRPVITYLTFFLYGALHIYRFAKPLGSDWTMEALQLVQPVLYIVLAFWFGEKLLSRSGIAEVLRK